MPLKLDEIDPTFVDDLVASKEAVVIAAKWLSGRGHAVVIHPIFIRPNPSEIAEYSDSGDLSIMQRIEIKHRPELRFTCAADFPYGSIIVDVSHAYDRARPKPYAYMIFNADLKNVAIVMGSTSPHWYRMVRYDRRRNRDREFYFCPLSYVVFSVVVVQ